MKPESTTASIIFAAGMGSRMKGFKGNKTLLPLIRSQSPFKGNRPILLHIIDHLPSGPMAIIINHRKEDVIESTSYLGLKYYEQPILNGTGGALIASKEFIEAEDYDQFIITMGDVPLVRKKTYDSLVKGLNQNIMMVLGFRPVDKKQYGVLRVDGGFVREIVEWKYWKSFPAQEQNDLNICNSGIYAVRRDELVNYIHILEKKPHKVLKEKNGKMVEIEEFFITDIIKLMREGGLKVGYSIVEDENEVMGVDDLSSLKKAQRLFKIMENDEIEQPTG